MSTNVNSEKVRDALKVLDSVARESSEDLEKMLRSDYKSFKRTLTHAVPKIEGALEEYSSAAADALDNARQFASEKAGEVAHQVDGSIRKNPYPFMIGTAVVGGILGAAIAKTIEHHSAASR